MKKRKIIWISLIVLVAAAGLILFRCSRGQENGMGSFQLAAVSRDDVKVSITATGRLEPVDQVEVGSEVSGTLSKILVDYNSKVRKGQLLAVIDPSKIQAAVDQVQSNLDAAVTEEQYLKVKLDRAKKLSETGAASASDLEDAEYQWKNAASSVERLRSSLKQSQVDLQNTSIRAPMDGVVLSRSVDAGQTVAASLNAPTLFVIANDLSRMQVEASVDEADIGQVKEGQSATFTADAFPNQTFEGVVRQVRLSPTISSNVVTYTVVIDAPNPKLLLIPGLTVNVDILVQESKNALAVSRKAIAFRPTAPDGSKAPKGRGSAVWVLEQGMPRPVPVKTGLDNGSVVEILSGVSEGDSVIVGQSQMSASGSDASSGTNPFMPKMPGRNNKKSGSKNSQPGPPPGG